MAVYTEKQLAQNAQAGVGATTVYTVPASTTTIVKQIIIANTTNAAAVYTVNIVPAAGAAAAANQIIPGSTFPANSTTVFDLTQVMAASGFISIQQGTASAITITISGVEKV